MFRVFGGVLSIYRLFYTPTWFNGWDVVFDVVGLIVCLLIAAYSWRVYRINRENKFAYFSLALVLVALGFLSKVFTSSVLYFTPLRDVVAEVLQPFTGPRLSFSSLFYRAAFFIQMASTLAAWIVVFFVSQKARARLRRFHEVAQIALFAYLLLLITVVSNFQYYVFYLTSAVILGLIVLNYFKNYLNTNGNRNALLVMLSFLFILFGNFFFIFVFLSTSLYVVGEALVLIGFLILLYTYTQVKRRKD